MMAADIKTILGGDLPCWIPDPKRIKFYADLDALRKAHQLTDDDIAGQVAEVLAVHTESMKDPAFALHIERGRSVTNGQPVSERIARRERMIQFMAIIVYAVILGQETGLALLTDAEHAKNTTIGARTRLANSQKAKLHRGKVGDIDSGDAFAEIIDQLANELDGIGDYTPAPGLWEPLFNKLENAGAEPKLVRSPCAPRKARYYFTANGKSRHITKGRFETLIAQHRRKVSR